MVGKSKIYTENEENIVCKCGGVTWSFQIHLWAKNQKAIVQLTVYENACI